MRPLAVLAALPLLALALHAQGRNYGRSMVITQQGIAGDQSDARFLRAGAREWLFI